VTVIDATPVELAVAVATEPPTRNVTTAPGQKPVALSGSDPRSDAPASGLYADRRRECCPAAPALSMGDEQRDAAVALRVLRRIASWLLLENWMRSHSTGRLFRSVGPVGHVGSGHVWRRARPAREQRRYPSFPDAIARRSPTPVTALKAIVASGPASRDAVPTSPPARTLRRSDDVRVFAAVGLVARNAHGGRSQPLRRRWRDRGIEHTCSRFGGGCGGRDVSSGTVRNMQHG
jgi:hypothetical protein